MSTPAERLRSNIHPQYGISYQRNAALTDDIRAVLDEREALLKEKDRLLDVCTEHTKIRNRLKFELAKAQMEAASEVTDNRNLRKGHVSLLFAFQHEADKLSASQSLLKRALGELRDCRWCGGGSFEDLIADIGKEVGE